MSRIVILIDEYLRTENGDFNIYGKLIAIVFIIFSIKLIMGLINRIIDRTLRDKKQTNYFVNNKRANTIGILLKKLVKYVLCFIGSLTILDMFGIRTTSILATAGVGGLAIGFGAQSLVRDVITGFFIILENQFSVGDYIQISTYEGVVEELGMRVTKLRDFSGELHIIPNGNIKIVTNKTRGAMRALVTMSISYEADVNKAIKVLEDVCKDIKNNYETIVEGPDVVGIVNLGDYNVDINIVAKTNPMDQWNMERIIRKKSKEALERADIEIPYPKNVILRENNEKPL